MENKVARFAATPDPTFGQKPSPRKSQRGARRQGDGAEPDHADLRLVIEEDEANGTLIYKTIDRRTGEVVLQLPREQLERLGEGSEYVAGTVIRAKA